MPFATDEYVIDLVETFHLHPRQIIRFNEICNNTGKGVCRFKSYRTTSQYQLKLWLVSKNSSYIRK